MGSKKITLFVPSARSLFRKAGIAVDATRPSDNSPPLTHLAASKMERAAGSDDDDNDGDDDDDDEDDEDDDEDDDGDGGSGGNEILCHCGNGSIMASSGSS